MIKAEFATARALLPYGMSNSFTSNQEDGRTASNRSNLKDGTG